MEISRYLNGRSVKREELLMLSVNTPELTSAVKEARKRAKSEDDKEYKKSDTVNG